MLIDFVNHASFTIIDGDVRLIADPWLEGRVFHDGWALTSQSKMTFDDFKDITHIWFSHEHPDHFLPDNIKKIPAEYRKNIHVLYQETKDKKVVRYCQRMGFGQVTELPARKWFRLGERMEILNAPNDTNWLADSWLCVRTPDATLLNLNDCGAASELPAIKSLIGKIDVLATQFSFAQWEKNRDAVEHRNAHEQRILTAVKGQIDILQPRYVIPFASFTWFCTPDNFYLNNEKNKVRDVRDFIQNNTDAKPIVMYPGDRWTVGLDHDSEHAVVRFEADKAALGDPMRYPLTRHETVDKAVLIEAGQSFRQRLMGVGDPLLVRIYLALQSYRNRSDMRADRISNLLQLATLSVDRATIYVTDLGQAFAFDLTRGLYAIDEPASACDIQLVSASLAYFFNFNWGGETLYVNGCFQENENWRQVESMAYPNRLFKYCNLLRRADLGYELNWSKVGRSVSRKFGILPRSTQPEAS